MDRYLFALEELARDDYRRLRAYTPDARARFSTWLAIVVRRLCLDHHRSRYGRSPAPGTNPQHDPRARRRLVDLVGSELEFERLAAPGEVRADRRLERTETREALEAAVAARPSKDRLLLTPGSRRS